MKKIFLLLTFFFIAVGINAQDVIYSNSFDAGLGNATIVGDGALEWDTTKGFGYVYHNAILGEALRTNYLRLDSNIFADISNAGTYEMSISFWANFGTAANWFWSPIFSAYGAAPIGGNNTWPLMVLQTRLVMQTNIWGYCDYTDAQNVTGANTVSATWVEDDDWHLYTMTLDTTSAKIYTDDTLRNEWTLTNTDGNTSNGIFTNGAELKYVCLGGNQAWDWGDPDPAFKYDDVRIYSKVLDSLQIVSIIADKKSGLDTVISYTTCASYISPSGKEWTTTGLYQDTIPNTANTGDSIIVVNLTILNSVFEITTESCVSYTSPSGKVWTVSDTYTDTIENAAGCDSIITINLTMTDILHTNVSESFCNQTSYTSPTGKIWSTTGVYKDTLSSSAGCDSVITFNLTFSTSTASNITESICGGTYSAPSGKVLSETGTFADTIPNKSGCDSVITISLTVNTITIAGDIDCSGIIEVDEGEIAGDINGDGTIGAGEIEGDIDGDGSIGAGEVEGDTNGNGVLDGDEILVSINEKLASDINIYPIPATDVINITAKNIVIEKVQIRTITGSLVIDKSVNENEVSVDFTAFDSGMYFVTVITNQGQFNKRIIK